MVNLLDWLQKRWGDAPRRQTLVQIDPSHVDPGSDDAPLFAGEHYLRLRLVEMSLAGDRKWFDDWHPAVYSVVRLLFGDRVESIPHLAESSLLKGLNRAAIGKSVPLNYGLTALLPFNGGDVEIDTGLLAVRGQEEIKDRLGVLGKFSQRLVVPELSSALKLVESLAKGVSDLIATTDARPSLRFKSTFAGGEGANRLRSGYFLVVSGSGDLDPSSVWIDQDRVLYGASKATAEPLSGRDYLLYRIEATRARDDWDGLTKIQEPYTRAVVSLEEAAYEADPAAQRRLLQSADEQYASARDAALSAAELTRIGGRNQIMNGLMVAFQRAKQAAGLGLSDAEVPRALSEIVAQGWSVGEALSIGELPESVWLSGEPIPMAAPPTRSLPPAESPPERQTTRAKPPEPTRGGLEAGLERSIDDDPGFESVGATPAEMEPDAESARGDESVIVTRTPHMDVVASGPLRPGAAFTVEVYADLTAARPGEESEDVTLAVPKATTQVDLEVWIEGSSHFTFPETRVQPYTIFLQPPKDPPHAVFNVQVRDDITDASGAFLRGNFMHEGRASGHVRVNVELAQPAAVIVASQPAEAPGPQRTDAIHVDAAAARPDLTITITDPENTKQHLTCRLSTPHLPAAEVSEPFAWNLDRQTDELVGSYMAEFVKANITKEDRLLNLKGAGRQLWDHTPPRLKEVFWKLVDAKKLKTIHIVSEEPYIPWELMVPRRGAQIRKPLGAEFLVGRWLPSDFTSPSQQLVLSNSLVVAPNYPRGQSPKPLEKAQAEALLVLRAVDGKAAVPATLAGLRKRFSEKAVKLLHFVCHGADSPENPDTRKKSFGIQAIYLEGGQWTSLQAAGMDDLVTAFANHPLVFLNACEIGRLSSALVGVGGFAKVFIDAGASAVIAPLWSVRDSLAHKVAEKFYGELEKGAPVNVAEVFRDIRLKAYDESDPEAAGEDTYAAYCFYGDPSAMALIPPKGASQ